VRTNDVPYSDQPPGATPDDTRVVNYYYPDGLANGYNDGYAVTGSTTFSPTQNYLTDVGAYTSSSSFYGTYDQNGNVEEWNEALLSGGTRRGRRGGGAYSTSPALRSTTGQPGLAPSREFEFSGFRVATVPEPSTYFLAAMGIVALLFARRRNRA
jgi:hypothetical protein